MPQHPSPAELVASRRAACGWTQAELSARAGIPRTTISAIEGGHLTPSVTAALALAAALGTTVEEIFGNGTTAPATSGEPAWAWPPASTVARYWCAEVGSRSLLYPVEPPASHTEPHDGIWRGGIPDERTSAPVDTLVLASCDPAAGLLASAYARASGFRLLVIERGGAAALGLLEKGLVHIAGIHRSTPADPARNADTVLSRLGTGHRLLRLAEWQEGLAIPTHRKSASLASLTRGSRSWALREPGSAARECLDELLDGREAPGRCLPGHMAVASAVSAGWADAGICVEIAAMESGLRFLPVRTESLDLCIPAIHLRDPRVRALLSLLRSRSHRRLIADLPGYDATHTGEIADL